MRIPTRRNRNIGTENQGYGKETTFDIPSLFWGERACYERLNSPVRVKRIIHGKKFLFLVEPTLKDYTHSCTIDDIERIIQLLPGQGITGIDLFILRQATRKQDLFDSCWGRLVYYYEGERFQGPAIIIEARPIGVPIKWSKHVGPEQKAELSRLEEDGHKLVYSKRAILVDRTIDSCRNTQLYRTIPHEVGHYVDFLRCEKLGIDMDSIPSVEKETFAHRYADGFLESQKESGQIPFPRIFDESSLIKDRLKPEWFVCNE